MAANDVIFGKLLDRIDRVQRDAVHVAVTPVMISDDELAPGAHVGIIKVIVKFMFVGVSKNPIGIIDPFLTSPVKANEQCWLFLYQNTINDMRHHWTHMTFDAQLAQSEKIQPGDPMPNIAEPGLNPMVWLMQFAEMLNLDYDYLIEGTDGWVEHEDYIRENTESYHDVSDRDWRQFWTCYEAVTNTKVPEEKKSNSFFSCSC